MRSDLGERTKQFALRVVRFYVGLPKTTEMQVLGKQMLRSGTSVGAHYREASRSRSDAEFIAKVEGGLQELVETGYWLELLGIYKLATTPQFPICWMKSANSTPYSPPASEKSKRNNA